MKIILCRHKRSHRIASNWAGQTILFCQSCGKICVGDGRWHIPNDMESFVYKEVMR